MATTPTLQSPHHPRWQLLALFLLALAVLLQVNWSLINTVNVEIGDFAANSLLIQDAKSLHLIYGNYSRVGFNHPGPAILYVLALGEWLLYDLLHLVPSGLSGQLAAVAAYNAAWITLIYALMRRISGSAMGALLMLSVYLLCTALCDWCIFAGLWFPHLYFFPFTALMLAISRLVYGKTDALVALGVSTGFLINGHVSFVATIGIMLVLLTALNYRLTRGQPELRIWSMAFLRQHRRQLLLCGGIVLLFLVPFFIACLIDRPTPVQQYLRFGRGNKGNTVLQALGYVGLYWGQGAAVVSGLVLAALVYFSAGGQQRFQSEASKSVMATVLAATIATLYYAKAGVDMLDQTYIALFYYGVPCLVTGLAALYCYQRVTLPPKGLLAALLCVLCLVPAYRKFSVPPHYAADYNQPQAVELYQAIKQLQPAGGGRVVLDLDNDNGPEWGYVWSRTLSALLYAKRQHQALFCINQQWHISFTKPLQCRPDELKTAARYVVYKTGPRVRPGQTPAAQAMGLTLLPFAMAPVKAGQELTVKAQPAYFNHALLQSGWSDVESEFVWSQGPQAVLALAVAPGSSGKIVLDVMAFLPQPGTRQQVTVLVNDQPAGSYQFSQDDNRKQLPVSFEAGAAGEVLIKLKIATPLSPKSLGLSEDQRALGVALYGYKS